MKSTKGRKRRCPLVMIEWEDSAQPAPAWRHLSDIPKPKGVRCASVGWLLHDGRVKALAPNMGAIGDEMNIQASGVIEIPSRCVVRVHRLREP